MKHEVKVGTLCNNNCVFCLNDRRDIDVPFLDIQSRIETARDLGVNSIDLTGGEPSLRKDFLRMVSLVKANNMGLCVHTNGRSFSYAGMCDRITELGKHAFLVSLHAHNEGLNRKLTQVEGGFRQTVEGIRNLLARGHFVYVNVVINRLNARFLPEIAEHHAGLGVHSVQLSWVRPAGKAAQDIKGLIPMYSEYSENLEKAICILKEKGTNVFVISVPPCVMEGTVDAVCNPYEDSIVIRDGREIDATGSFNDEHKMKLASCRACRFSPSCGGFFRLYAGEYGTSEFRPVKITSSEGCKGPGQDSAHP